MTSQSVSQSVSQIWTNKELSDQFKLENWLLGGSLQSVKEFDKWSRTDTINSVIWLIEIVMKIFLLNSIIIIH